MQHIVVIGAGTMGNGIAHTAAASGLEVTLVDVAQEFLDRGMKAISANLQRGVDKGKISAGEKAEIIGRIRQSTSVADAAAGDLVIEAILENLAAKSALFRQLDEITPPETILASNTSSISITRLGAVTRRPDKVIGMHFMNPVPVMQLVEVIRGQATSEETFAATAALVAGLGKEMAVSRDYPGFI